MSVCSCSVCRGGGGAGVGGAHKGHPAALRGHRHHRERLRTAGAALRGRPEQAVRRGHRAGGVPAVSPRSRAVGSHRRPGHPGGGLALRAGGRGGQQTLRLLQRRGAHVAVCDGAGGGGVQAHEQQVVLLQLRSVRRARGLGALPRHAALQVHRVRRRGRRAGRLLPLQRR